MATTIGPELRTIGDIVQILTKCSKPEADAAELLICKSPTAVQTLLEACGIGTAFVGFGGLLVVDGLATGGTTVLPGLAIGSVGWMTAKRFCQAAVDRALPVEADAIDQ